MTQPTLFSTRQSYTDALVALFTGQPHTPISAYTLMASAGRMAWRTRVSDARKRLHRAGLGTITNTQRRDAAGRCESFYTFIPGDGR